MFSSLIPQVQFAIVGVLLMFQIINALIGKKHKEKQKKKLMYEVLLHLKYLKNDQVCVNHLLK